MKRIVFLDYVRVFACFLVMIVHASENFYGAAGSTDMAGPQSYLPSEADRLWVAVYDGFSRMAVPLFMIVSAFLLAPMKEGQTTWQFYRQRFIRIVPPFFIFMILYSTLPMLWGQLNEETSLKDLSDTGRTPVVHVPSDQPLLIHTHNIAMAEKSHGKRRTFLHRIVLIINMYTLSKPLVR